MQLNAQMIKRARTVETQAILLVIVGMILFAMCAALLVMWQGNAQREMLLGRGVEVVTMVVFEISSAAAATSWVI